LNEVAHGGWQLYIIITHLRDPAIAESRRLRSAIVDDTYRLDIALPSHLPGS
jgi:hypothetical protein